MLEQHYQTRAVTSTRLINVLPQSDLLCSILTIKKSHWKWSKTHWCSAGPQFEAKAFEFAPTISRTQLQNVWYATFRFLTQAAKSPDSSPGNSGQILGNAVSVFASNKAGLTCLQSHSQYSEAVPALSQH